MKAAPLLLLIPLLLLGQKSYSQKLKDGKNEIIEQQIDFLLDGNEDGDVDYTTLFENLEYYYEHPLNLNRATKTDLDALGLLNDIQINNLLKHIEKYGKLITLEELQSIDGFSLEDIRRIAPFTKVNGDLNQATFNLKNILKEGQSQFFLRYSQVLEEQKGFSVIDEKELEENPNSRYLGSPYRLYSRYRFKYSNQLSIGVTAEKDPGEEFFQNTQANGFDFYSAHFFMQGLGKVKQIALGDFQAQFGQGLTFWSGLAFGRSPNISTLKRNASKLRPYTSVQEDLFLRGGGITLENNNFELTVFYSSHKVDANISIFDTLNQEYIISSLPEDGYHRTPYELDKKNSINNSYLGGNLSFQKRNIELGITAVHNVVDANLQKKENNYNRFNRLTNENTNVGFNYSYLYKNANLFGEITQSIDGGIAYTNGLMIVLDPRLSLAIQNRKFERDFVPIQSNAIGENNINTNEAGTFMGFDAKILKNFTLSAYADQFAFSWLKFQTDAPSTGYRLLTQLNYRPNRGSEVYFRFRERNKERNERNTTEGVAQIKDEDRKEFRLHFSYKITETILLKSRVEYCRYQLDGSSQENGLLVYQDLTYKQLSFPLSFSVRYAIFDTDSYNSRIYAYENDVLYAFSIPAYYGRGSRFYISTKYHISRNLDCWLRFAQSYYSDRNSIGNGRDLIAGNTKSEIKAQLRLKF